MSHAARGWRAAIYASVIVACCASIGCGTQTQQTTDSVCDQPPDRVIRLHNIKYGTAPLDLLDLFLPQSRAGEPLLVLVHGGGWRGGDKGNYGLIARHLSRCGIAVANIDYPMGPTTYSDTQAASTLRALVWAEEKAAVYGYAPDRTTILGHSAGAQIATLAALDPALAPLRRNIQISGVIAISGLGYVPPHPSEVSALSEYLRQFYYAAFGPDLSRWQRYNVTRFVHAGLPAFLVIHARDDTVSPEVDSSALVIALRGAGADVDYIEPTDRDHDSVLGDVPLIRDDPTRLVIERFILSR